MSKIYSHSRISSFEKCPKQFHFRYVLKIPSDREGIEAFVGKRVHEVLERLYEFAAEGKLPSLERVIYRYRVLWDEHYDPKRIAIARKENSPRFYLELGERCLGHYYRRHYPFDAETTLGLEKRLIFSLDPDGRYRVQGIIDRICRASDGALEIHDYKSGARVLSQKDSDKDRQLALYQIAAEEHYSWQGEVRLVWHYLQTDTTRISSRTPEQLAELREKTISAIDTIETAADYPAKPSPLCGWCDYAKICRDSALYDPEAEKAVELQLAKKDPQTSLL